MKNLPEVCPRCDELSEILANAILEAEDHMGAERIVIGIGFALIRASEALEQDGQYARAAIMAAAGYRLTGNIEMEGKLDA